MAATEVKLEDILGNLLEAETVESVTELEIDPVQMPVAKSSVTYTITIHC